MESVYFKVYCPGQYKRPPHKLIMYQDGSVSKNVKCTDKSIVNVAYNNEWGHFFVFRNSMRILNRQDIHMYMYSYTVLKKNYAQFNKHFTIYLQRNINDRFYI